MMQDYLLKIRLLSPVGTPWHSDTIFGHLCWQVAYGVIDIGIDQFLEPFRNGRAPFVLSDAFPANRLPRPLLNIEFTTTGTLEEYVEFKHKKKAPFVGSDDFLQICRGQMPCDQAFDDSPWITGSTLHASLDRIKFTTGHEGALYSTDFSLLDTEDSIIDIYIRCDEGWIDKVMALVEACSKSGFGRDKSIGMGKFEVVEYKPFEEFKILKDANGFVSLSSMVPANDDPPDARYRLRTKYGKIGEGAGRNPFKRPLLQMEPGAVFRTDDGVRDYYGRLVEGIAPGDNRVVQNCFCLPIACVIE
ncbi:MAG: hypothetical protein CVT49_15790 [candidate division Zixibacteria bacterium HGW-Zixibacteria-1]|nr:MAG: hypothetical protein CVT49_15790 [candidate division Zixibacteria bacterium HGW-Zixibacteria-1]